MGDDKDLLGLFVGVYKVRDFHGTVLGKCTPTVKMH